jgi:hypothetical protein
MKKGHGGRKTLEMVKGLFIYLGKTLYLPAV